MLKFNEPEITDKQWVDECLKHANSLNCEYSFGNIFVWKNIYNTKICRYNDFFICRWGKGDDISYSLPLGEGDFSSSINAIIEDAKSIGVIPKIYGVTDGYQAMLKESFTGKFDYEYDDAYSDYIYDVNKMSGLIGKKYHSKRNHINNFKKNHPNWKFEIIDASNINDCIEFHTKWINQKVETAEDDEDFSLELEAALTTFDNYDKLGFIGGLIRIDGEVIAYTMGEPNIKGNCFITHFEKAYADIQGAYPIINQEFTKQCLGTYDFVNREEDLGIDSLRKAKQSYYPEILLKKCIAVYND